MKPRRIILELGAGASLHGGDYTKAALRAVDDAIHHSSLSFIHNLGLDARKMEVTVTIGAQKPELVDKAKVAAKLPHGQVTVEVIKGGLDVPDPDHDDITVLASAAIAVRMVLPKPG
jgi:uncharacterized protein (TIGR02058 family)